MRLDVYLATNNYFQTRAKSVDAIKKGLVTVNGKVADKPSKEVSDSDEIVVTGELKFVSKGGYKLDKALDEFGAVISGKVFADIGASTGGFTDCLLKRGAKRVYAVDIGENQLDASLLDSGNVVVLDNTNARYLKKDDFKERLDGITVDCSFISLKLLLAAFFDILDEDGVLYALIKPQFECGAKNLPKSGVLKDDKVRERVVFDVLNEAKSFGFIPINISHAPKFKDKNLEYVVFFAKKGSECDMNIIKECLRQ